MHAGTTDIDVQVDLEIACGAVNTRGLEEALMNAEFEPDGSKAKDWYDIAYVLVFNDAGGPTAAAAAVRRVLGPDMPGSARTALGDLADNFANPGDQGPQAYAEQLLADRVDLNLDYGSLLVDAVAAVRTFHKTVTTGWLNPSRVGELDGAGHASVLVRGLSGGSVRGRVSVRAVRCWLVLAGLGSSRWTRCCCAGSRCTGRIPRSANEHQLATTLAIPAEPTRTWTRRARPPGGPERRAPLRSRRPSRRISGTFTMKAGWTSCISTSHLKCQKFATQSPKKRNSSTNLSQKAH